jgi:DNA-3-methyladenine glycosylase II
MKFTFETQVPVSPPYRLDFTVDALRRLAANVVDVVDASGIYRRALADARGVNLVEVTQPSARSLRIRAAGRNGSRWVPVLERMLGTHVRLDDWYERVRPFPWLAYLTRELKGLRPPRYPTMWEALANAIVFQQISIHAAGSIMRRTVEALGEPLEYAGGLYFPFLTPQAVLAAPEKTLREAGLSGNKITHLRSAAAAILDELVGDEMLEALPSPAAAQRLTAVKGIGAWSAAVVLLRGFGRLDVFPLKDSGVARSLKALSGNTEIDAHALLEALGPVRGMLYFHLLLGRVHNLGPLREEPAV